MNVTPSSLLALDNANDSLGSPFSNVSPYLIDVVTLIIVIALYRYSVVNGAGVLVGVGYLFASSLAVWGALRANAIYHFIADTPKSKMQSAAQGFVELQGTCDFFGNRACQGFMSGPPCVWHRYTIVNMAGLFNMGASTIPFVVSDDTGSVVINPTGAKVISSSKRTWFESGKRFSSKYIVPGSEIYVLGELRTRGGAETTYNKGMEVSKLLSVWKKDSRWLHEEFDTDGNGVLDQDEWDSARARAEEISRDIHEEKVADPVANIISKPENGMPFIISDRDPAPLGNTFRAVAYLNVGVAVGCFVWGCLLLG